MDYEDAVSRLYQLQSSRKTILTRRASGTRRKSVVTVQHLLHILNVDISKLRVIHIAGSKGKGSTCAFLESILRAHGLKTGTFMSPHLVHPRERIRINFKPISKALFSSLFFKIYARLQGIIEKDKSFQMPGYFKFLTLMGLAAFVENKVDVAVIEVGIGGRLDSTNVFENPCACGITRIELEHTEILGSSLEDIAFEKAGILKPGVRGCSVAQSPVVARVLQGCSSQMSAKLQFMASPVPDGPGTVLGLPGEHQKENSALAVRLSQMFLDCIYERADAVQGAPRILDRHLVLQALASARLDGRCQVLPLGDALLHLDGAHTPNSMEACYEWFLSNAGLAKEPRRRCRLLFYCGEDKHSKELLQILARDDLFSQVVFCAPFVGVPGAHERRPSDGNIKQANALLSQWKGSLCPARVSVNAADALRDLGSELVLICGSFFLVGEVLHYVHERK